MNDLKLSHDFHMALICTEFREQSEIAAKVQKSFLQRVKNFPLAGTYYYRCFQAEVKLKKILNNFSILNDTDMILKSLESGFLGAFGDTKSIPIACWHHIKPKKT